MENKEQLEKKGKGNTLLKFVKKTKEGEYAEIDEDSINVSRAKQRTIVSNNQDDFYYYGVS